MPIERFKNAEAYRRWNAYRHIHGIPAPGLKTAVIAGKAHTVHHSGLSKPMDHKTSKRTRPKKNFIKSAIKHPGALTEAAKRHGVSKLQEAERESHSSNKSVRSRGNLGLRFIKHTV